MVSMVSYVAGTALSLFKTCPQDLHEAGSLLSKRLLAAGLISVLAFSALEKYAEGAVHRQIAVAAATGQTLQIPMIAKFIFSFNSLHILIGLVAFNVLLTGTQYLYVKIRHLKNAIIPSAEAAANLPLQGRVEEQSSFIKRHGLVAVLLMSQIVTIGLLLTKRGL